ncbi:MAG: diaminopimelate epimerase [Chlamydiales bacterium]|nr:diaminopimelate epimerase [Chlamydiia bacterium]MCP5507617.1 diaminopimelate epimerase [Chlamydiales bacterium]
MDSLCFSKYSGCGNDFILIDNRHNLFAEGLKPEQVRNLCDRHRGVGADGVILLNSSTVADYRMVIYNSDGGEAEMCGNGIRCIGLFIRDLGDQRTELTIETYERVLSIIIDGSDVHVMMGEPSDTLWNQALEVDGKELIVHYLNTGVPHVVYFVEGDELPISQLGKAIRNHESYAPSGANVNRVVVNDKEICIETYERGVEGVTQACGTGATATALAAAQILQLPAPVSVKVPSGDRLLITFKESGTTYTDVWMKGSAALLFTGKVNLVFKNTH